MLLQAIPCVCQSMCLDYILSIEDNLFLAKQLVNDRFQNTKHPLYSCHYCNASLWLASMGMFVALPKLKCVALNMASRTSHHPYSSSNHDTFECCKSLL